MQEQIAPGIELGGKQAAELQRPLPMSKSSDSSLPSDMCLLLRADAEQCWLHREVIPVLREVETREQIDEEEVGAALAYLDAMWSEATMRARATDAAHASLHSDSGGDQTLSWHAGRYHAAVCALREIVAARIAPLVRSAAESHGGFCGGQGGSLLAQAPGTGGCAPRAA